MAQCRAKTCQVSWYEQVLCDGWIAKAGRSTICLSSFGLETWLTLVFLCRWGFPEQMCQNLHAAARRSWVRPPSYCERLSSGPTRGSLGGVRNRTQMAGWLSGPLLLQLLQLLWMCARSRGTETVPVGSHSVRIATGFNGNGYGARQTKASFPTRTRGDKNYIVLVGGILHGATEAEKKK